MTILIVDEVVVAVEDEDEGDAFAISKTIATLWHCYSIVITFYIKELLDQALILEG